MSVVRINMVGRIESGQEQGRFVRVENDRERTGGFLIVTAADPALKVDGADYWVETEDDLQAFFRESNWVVEWLS